MPDGDVPGNAELMRAIEAVRTDIREMRSDMTRDYVRQDVQNQRELLTSTQIQGLEDEQGAINKRITLSDATTKARFDTLDTNALQLKRIFLVALLTFLSTIVAGFLLYGIHVK